MEYDIEKIKRKMLVKYPFFGSIVASVNYKPNKSIQTAGTDGKLIYYNPDFLANLSIEEQVFTLAHEVCHIAFNHILRSEGKDANTWNIATDAVINAHLKRDGLKMIDGVVDIDEAIYYDAEEYYEKILKDKKQSGGGSSSASDLQEKKNNSSSESGESSSQEEKQDVGHDTHSMWEDAIKKHKEEPNQKESLLDKLFNRDKKEKTIEQSEIKKKQEEIEKLGEKEAFKKNKEEKKKNLEDLKEELANQTMSVGASTNSDIINITNVGKASPLVNWESLLRGVIKYNIDWSYKNATIENGVVTPHLEYIPFPETEIVLDTSGSIDTNLLKNFLRECKNILKYSKLKVGCFDTKFYGFHEIRTEEDIENMRFEGGGGTDFEVAVSAFSRRVENKIIFTDGEAYMPQTQLNAIWIVFGNNKINPKGGKVLYINDQQLSKLKLYIPDNQTKIDNSNIKVRKLK